MSDHQQSGASRSARLDRVLRDLLAQAPELEASAVVSFDGLPMASALPADMDEDRVAAMSAALLSLGERAAQGLGRGDLSQVYVEGESGTVFLVSADDEAVLVAVAAKAAKVGLMLFEVRRAAAAVAAALRLDEPAYEPAVEWAAESLPEPLAEPLAASLPEPLAEWPEHPAYDDDLSPEPRHASHTQSQAHLQAVPTQGIDSVSDNEPENEPEDRWTSYAPPAPQTDSAEPSNW